MYARWRPHVAANAQWLHGRWRRWRRRLDDSRDADADPTWNAVNEVAQPEVGGSHHRRRYFRDDLVGLLDGCRGWRYRANGSRPRRWRNRWHLRRYHHER